ncbi:MAG: cob(I)yrinic acid a,c-diamide adenosyltransferase [Phycisphaerales bacterium]|nr:cob(I)yrinic acid a,c-diamide adenosyltransferase [Phycisphaerales bacterium]
MVKLNRIYTRTGDNGTTGLVTGVRVSKADIRVRAYGEVDEANASVGLAVCHASSGAHLGRHDRRIASELRRIQHDLFDLGADLATPVGEVDQRPRKPLRILPEQATRLEHLIDEFNEHLEPLRSFVLPGGSLLASALHLARTVTRRAERTAVELMQSDAAGTNPHAITYLNRLSDLLFVLARLANDEGRADELWVPGATRAG